MFRPQGVLDNKSVQDYYTQTLIVVKLMIVFFQVFPAYILAMKTYTVAVAGTGSNSYGRSGAFYILKSPKRPL